MDGERNNMKKFKEKLEFYIMYFSFKERKKREYEKFENSIKKLEKLSTDELEAEYIDIKAKYEYKKIFSLTFGIVILLILNQIFKFFYYIFENSLKLINLKGNYVEMGKVMIILVIIFSVIFILLVFIFIISSINKLKLLYKNLLIIKLVRKMK